MLWATDGTPFVRTCSAGAFLHDFPDLVLDDRFDDVPPVFLAFRQRFGELPRLLRGDLSGERRLVRIDGRFDQRGAGMMKRFAEYGPHERRIFDALFSTRPDGTGLGLTVSRRILDSHGGRIALEPTERGARFALTVPQRR